MSYGEEMLINIAGNMIGYIKKNYVGIKRMNNMRKKQIIRGVICFKVDYKSGKLET